MLNKLKNIVTALFSNKTRDYDKDPLAFYEELVSIAKEQLEKQPSKNRFVVSDNRTKHHYIFKLVNTVTKRVLRVEIPTLDNINQKIHVVHLERKENIIENLSSFYDTYTLSIRNKEELMNYFKTGAIFSKWITDHVYRNNDVDYANATLLPSLYIVPDKEDIVYVDVISSVEIEEENDEEVTLSISLCHNSGASETEVITIPSSMQKHFKKNSIYVVTHSGSVMAVPLSKARHYLRFDKEAWSTIHKYLLTEGDQ